MPYSASRATKKAGAKEPLLAVGLALAIILLLRWIPGDSLLSDDIMQAMSTIFLSIIIEALPFILLGVFVSALIHVFVSEETVARIVPRHALVGMLAASFMGLLFPVCECGIVPVVRRLLAKGVPLSMGLCFLLAVPIINPVVMASTYFAFNGLEMVLLRLGMAFVVTMLAALTLGMLTRQNPLQRRAASQHHGHSCACCNPPQTGIFEKLYQTLIHACDEFFQMGRYLILGALLAAVLQTFVAREVLLRIGQNPLSSTLVMMALGYSLSLCSEADAFIAATFSQSFTLPAVLAFLVYGPMLDVKNTLMLMGTFKPGFVLKFMAVVTLVVLAVALGFHYICQGTHLYGMI